MGTGEEFSLVRLHSVPAIMAYTGFTLAAVYGMLHLSAQRNLKEHRIGAIFERLPSLDLLGHMSWYALVFGFVFITLTAASGPFLMSHATGPLEPKVGIKILVGSAAWVIYGVAVLRQAAGQVAGRPHLAHRRLRLPGHHDRPGRQHTAVIGVAMNISVIGVNHHTAPVDVREKVSLAGGLVPQLLQAIREEKIFQEALVLDTCNRTEVYYVPGEEEDAVEHMFAHVAQPQGHRAAEGHLGPVPPRRAGRPSSTSSAWRRGWSRRWSARTRYSARCARPTAWPSRRARRGSS